MLNSNRNVLLQTLVKHETLTIDDIIKKENLGITLNIKHAKHLLDDLQQDGKIALLSDVIPDTYTITEKGIEAYAILLDDAKLNVQKLQSGNEILL